MRKICLACAILAIICFSCAREAQAKTPITWRQDEDEIILYVDISSQASSELMSLLNETVTFEQASEFLVHNTDDKIPFYEGVMISAALTTRWIELKSEMEKKRSQGGMRLEIIGFKENPIKIVKGALDDSQAPKYLADFDPSKNPELVDELTNLMDGNEFVVEIYGRFPE